MKGKDMPKVTLAMLNMYYDNFEDIDDYSHILTTEPQIEKQVCLKQGFESLSEDARIIISTITETQDEIFKSMKSIVKYFKQQGWKKPKINKNIREIKRFLREV